MSQKKLKFQIKAIKDVSLEEQKIMQTLFLEYYEMPNPNDFFTDFQKKDHVIILRDKKTGEIKGFSTQKILTHAKDGKVYEGLFSGDTIIDKEYWGGAALKFGFFWYLSRRVLHKPWKRIYWHLISKGYKTYLLLTNGFVTFYPRHDKATPEFEQWLIDSFAEKLYPKDYIKDKGLLIFKEQHDYLKGDVAPIKEDLLKFPHIKFFSEKNPNWARGDELVCVGEFHLLLPILLALRITFKKIKKLLSI